MPLYRVYILDEDHQLEGVLNFECADDYSAQARAEQLTDGGGVTLWRLVAEFEFNAPRHRSSATTYTR